MTRQALTFLLFLATACGSVGPPQPAYLLEDFQSSGADAVAEVSPDASDVPKSGQGFGEACVEAKLPCTPGLFCMSNPNGKAYCSQPCAEADKGKACPGTPSGTIAACVARLDDGSLACAFACAAPGFTSACPPGLTCPATDQPPGSGQKLCNP